MHKRIDTFTEHGSDEFHEFCGLLGDKVELTGFNGFKGGTVGSRIDFIFHTADFTATAAAIDRTSRAGRYPSDHYPVTAVLQFK